MSVTPGAVPAAPLRPKKLTDLSEADVLAAMKHPALLDFASRDNTLGLQALLAALIVAAEAAGQGPTIRAHVREAAGAEARGDIDAYVGAEPAPAQL